MKKPTLCVIFGGKSSEYYVSLHSAYGVISHIDRGKYELVCLGITRGGEWYIFKGKEKEILNDTWHKGEVIPVTLDLSRGCLLALESHPYALDIDVLFPVMHGEYAEDGRLQGLFDIAGEKYVGCKSFSSHICMDKALTKDVAKSIGVPVARGYVLNAKCKMQNAKLTSLMSSLSEASRNAKLFYKGKAELGCPVFVKPCMCGSSVGVSRVLNEGELARAVDLAFKYCDKVLIEEAIDGDEVEVAVMEEGGELVVSPVGMIRYKSSFYDYSAKYESDEAEYLIPAPIDEKTSQYIKNSAKELFVALGCRGLSRFDFFVKKDGGVVFNEVNTMPGFTEISMFPKLFMSMGYTYSEIIDILIAGAM